MADFNLLKIWINYLCIVSLKYSIGRLNLKICRNFKAFCPHFGPWNEHIVKIAGFAGVKDTYCINKSLFSSLMFLCI